VFNGIKYITIKYGLKKWRQKMAFEFVENFTIELPEIKESDFNFSESSDFKNGLIIEVAAIHERINRQL
jgi:hypothetical protein